MHYGDERGYFLNAVVRRWLFVSLYAIVILLTAYILEGIELQQLRMSNYCMLDCIVRMDRPSVFGLVYFPLNVLVILSGQKRFESPVFVTRHDSLSGIWMEMNRRCGILAIRYSLLYGNIVILLSALSSPEFNNWRQKTSIYFQIHQHVFEGNGLLVLLLFLLFVFLKTYIACQIFMLSDCLSYGPVICCVIFAACIAAEWYGERSVFFNRFAVNYKNLQTPFHMFRNVLEGVLFCAVLYAAGKKVWKGMEFYGERWNR